MKIFRIFTTINLFLLILVFVPSLYSQAPEINVHEIFSTHKDYTILDIVAWSPNDKFIAIGGNNEGIPYIELLDPQEKTSTIFGPEEYLNDITSLDWNYDSTLLATSYFVSQGLIQIWDISKEGEPFLFLQLDHMPFHQNHSQISSLDWHPNKNLLMTVGGTALDYDPDPDEIRTIDIWDTETGELVYEIVNEDGYVLSAYWSSDGNYIAIIYLSGKIDLYDTTDFKFLKTLKEVEPKNSDEYVSRLLTWNLDTSKIAGADCMFANCEIWSIGVENMSRLSFTEDNKITSSSLSGIQWNPKYDILASAGSNETEIKLWNGEDGTKLLSIDAFETSIVGFSWNAEGDKLVAITREGDIKIWELTYN